MKKLMLLLVLLVGCTVSVSAAPYSEITLHEIGGLVYSDFNGEIETWGLSKSPGIETLTGWEFPNWWIQLSEKEKEFGVESYIGDLFFNDKSYKIAGLSVGKWDFVLTSNTPNPAPVPEPATIFLLSSGIGGLYAARKKKWIEA